MTHNQLKDKIDDIEYWQEQYAGKTFVKALRAVVELHRPIEQDHKQYEKCWNCDLVYPCPTINAVEKELK